MTRRIKIEFKAGRSMVVQCVEFESEYRHYPQESKLVGLRMRTTDNHGYYFQGDLVESYKEIYD